VENVYVILQQIFSGNWVLNFIIIARVLGKITFWSLFLQKETFWVLFLDRLYNVLKISFPSYIWPKLTHPAARSLCDSWATCTSPLNSDYWYWLIGNNHADNI